MSVLATILPEQAARECWDVLVVGAGPAGALAARGLVQQQLKTLLVDRKSFPRNKVCGSCISRRALSLIDYAGLTSPLEALKGVPLTRVDFLTRSRALRVGIPGGVAISRAELDEMFVQAAIAEGVGFLPQVNALVHPQPPTENSPTRRLDCTTSEGSPFTLQASVIVAADGLGHPSLRNCPEFADHIRRDSRLGLGTTLTTEAAGFELGSVTMAVGKAGYVGAVRLRNGPLHLAASVDSRALRTFSTPAELVARIFSEAQLPAIPELSEADWQGTLPLTRRSSTVAARRIFLIGDAAGYVEPFTGEGIAWALTTALAVRTFVKQAVQQDSKVSEHKWQDCYRQLIRHRQEWCRVLAWALRRPRLASAAIRLMKMAPAVPQFLINQLNHPVASTEWDFA